MDIRRKTEYVLDPSEKRIVNRARKLVEERRHLERAEARALVRMGEAKLPVRLIAEVLDIPLATAHRRLKRANG